MSNETNNPYLCGNYAPVLDELNVQNLTIEGQIPADLTGIYMRNGPNPAFPPRSYTYPYDGDGMIHAVYIRNGQASYRNRFVETQGLLKERKARKALYGGVFNPMPMEPQWATPEDEPVAFKNGAFIHVIRHGQKYLALSESFPAYEINSQLATLGEWAPYDKKPPLNVCAHTRRDPLTGELWFVNYSLAPPYLSVYRFDKEARPLQHWDIDTAHSFMVHDFVLTPNYVVIFACPAVFDLNGLMRGGEVLSWRPELGLRIGVMSRATGTMQWFTTEPFFVFHFANAYEQGQELIIDYIRHEKLVLLLSEKDTTLPPRLYRTRVNLQQKTVSHEQLDDRLCEFPRIREDRDTLEHQFIYAPTKTTLENSNKSFNALIQYDMSAQRSSVHLFGKTAEIGEAVFAPAASQRDENDGYVLLFVYESTTNHSDLVILDAQNIAVQPLARIRMPRRVPHGLHGSWMPGEWQGD